ncbi:MAG: hypothetical protein OQK76_02795 [Gammaproteobacteria bacterium]|nr:hypothetical protein [Gammaproteobacteria bacterium]MCW9055719.1 hypothetical protein [Gammaproteobacteria bacterium]
MRVPIEFDKFARSKFEHDFTEEIKATGNNIIGAMDTMKLKISLNIRV